MGRGLTGGLSAASPFKQDSGPAADWVQSKWKGKR
ncbi:hypothetical protein BIW11_03134 [Tropilaelaps mercedesae]|uniref:Uncharacterized protein n=1 Tax=Tropilaelaps mercedesae TaxID=418985 RepID=A0A1V9XRQ6_9ACAR|nr:hypothetical protein BIW11_03134 [Tropilaelaps mercedesae]